MLRRLCRFIGPAVLLTLCVTLRPASAAERQAAAGKSDRPAVHQGRRVLPAAQAVTTWNEMAARRHRPPGDRQDLSQSIPLTPQPPMPPSPDAADAGPPDLGGSAPTLGLRFKAAERTDTIDDMWPEGIRPPDTMGAVGPAHFVEVINGNVSIFDKSTGYRLSSVALLDFFAAVHTDDIPFDPRVLFDHHSGRWVAIAADCRCDPNVIVAGLSLTDDPTEAWFLFSFPAGGFADYPTLGVDHAGIYIAASFTDKVWAIDKAPLLGDPPAADTITEWDVSIIGALQPAHTYGSGPQYFVQTSGASALRIFELLGPIAKAVLIDRGTVTVPSYFSPPDAPALQSTVPISVGSGAGSRLMMAVYRDGSLWTCHTVGLDGRGACRWYEIDPAGLAVIQSGTVAHPTLHYYYPAIMVNQDGDALLGFSGSDNAQYVATYFSGRLSGEALGRMSAPLLLKEGEASYTVLDTNGRNRWGDYSYTTLDPVDELTFWTIQEYAASPENVWGTWVGQLSFAGFDCNGNAVADADDIASGVSDDCDANGLPDECQQDCNANNQADTCDLVSGGSSDADGDGIPDECQCAGDLDQDGSVGPADLAQLLGAWGPGPASPADLDGDGTVGASDLALLLGLWGSC